ncbi:MAG TPA: hypothetical protein VHC44_14615 [Verrucomicrobiae bacterium]|nr:hypothetical protein [Verrucomicrobiae bacterium]
MNKPNVIRMLAAVTAVMLGFPAHTSFAQEKKDVDPQWLYTVGGRIILFPSEAQPADFFAHQMPVLKYPVGKDEEAPPSALRWEKLKPEVKEVSAPAMKFKGHEIYCFTYREIYPQPKVTGLVVNNGWEEAVLAYKVTDGKEAGLFKPFLYVCNQEPGGIHVSTGADILVRAEHNRHPGPWTQIWTLAWLQNGPRLIENKSLIGGNQVESDEHYENGQSPSFLKRTD